MFPAPTIQFRSFYSKAEMPRKATEGSAGYDITTVDTRLLRPGQRALFRTGFGIVLPEGWEMQIRPRSGMALRHGITVLNTPGTIDSDFRGEVCVLLHNASDTPFQIEAGDRIAQAVFAPVFQVFLSWEHNGTTLGEALEETSRGAGGFGSTGVR